MSEQDDREFLGIRAGASQTDIDTAYQRLITEIEQDVSRIDHNAGLRYKRLADGAYERLTRQDRQPPASSVTYEHGRWVRSDAPTQEPPEPAASLDDAEVSPSMETAAPEAPAASETTADHAVRHTPESKRRRSMFTRAREGIAAEIDQTYQGLAGQAGGSPAPSGTVASPPEGNSSSTRTVLTTLAWVGVAVLILILLLSLVAVPVFLNQREQAKEAEIEAGRQAVERELDEAPAAVKEALCSYYRRDPSGTIDQAMASNPETERLSDDDDAAIRQVLAAVFEERCLYY